MKELRVVQVTNNVDKYPEHRSDTELCPFLVDYVEDEARMFVVDFESGDFWPADEFFYMVDIKTFFVNREEWEET